MQKNKDSIKTKWTANYSKKILFLVYENYHIYNFVAILLYIFDF